MVTLTESRVTVFPYQDRNEEVRAIRRRVEDSQRFIPMWTTRSPSSRCAAGVSPVVRSRTTIFPDGRVHHDVEESGFQGTELPLIPIEYVLIWR